MKKLLTILLVASLLCGIVAGVTVAELEPSNASAVESGYFLTMAQKGQLIWRGRIQDAQGDWYDVWIVPGYVDPGRRTTRYVKRAGSDFAEYI